MFYTRAFLSSTLSPSLFALNFKSAFTLSFSCKSPPEWIFSHLFNQALLACSQTMNKHITTQINAAKQARNEETRRRNMRVHNCQRSRFGFVARQLCGHHRNIYILGDPGAASRDDGIFMGESLQQERESPWALTLTERVPEAFEIPPSDWPEKYFSGQSAKRNSRATLMSSYTRLFSSSNAVVAWPVQRGHF